MKKYIFPIIEMFLILLVAMPVIAQVGQGGPDGRSMGPGMVGGRGMGMMGNPIASDVPDKLPIPRSPEWTQKLRDVLALERLSYAQDTADVKKFNVHMPYMMVIPQEEDHIRAIERLFNAFGMQADTRPLAVTQTKTITEALNVCVKLENDLIPRYEWLVKNNGDLTSAKILNEILLQTRHHLVMF
jgi:hypothetical protein